MVAKFLGGLDNPVNISQGGTSGDTLDGARDGLQVSADILPKSGDYTAVLADRGKFIHFSGAGPYTLTLDLATSLEASWVAAVRNDTSAVLTIDCSGADTINGMASITLEIGQSVDLFCDGVSALYSSGTYGLTPAGALLIANNLSDLASVTTARVNLQDSQVISAQTLAYTAVLTDRGKIIRYTGAGGVTLSLDPAATLLNGWWAVLRNDSLADITIDPDAGELIDGAATLAVEPGQAVTIYNNGSTFYTLGESLEPLPISGGTMTGTLTLNADPVNPLEAATKQYADSIASGIAIKQAVVAASTTAYTVTYANGAAGVGATLTNNGVQTAFSIDGVSPIVGDRVLIKDQTSTLQNGIYEVTDVGSGATNWVLTRTTDYDTPTEIAPGTLVPVNSAIPQNVNGGSSWIESATVTNVGADPILFTIFTQPASALAPSNAQYLTLAADPQLSNERVFTPSGGLQSTDGGAGMPYELVTGIEVNSQATDYTVIASDRAKFILYTGPGLDTITIDSAATLGDGFWCVIVNFGADGIDITPTAPDELWGLANIGLSAGQAVTIYCNGVDFWSTGEYQAPTELAATRALDNLTTTSINQSLEPDTDDTYNLGHLASRWDNVFATNVSTGHTIGHVMTISAWDVDGAVDVPFFTLTAGNTPTGVLSGDVTGVTQAANDNTTKLATTAYVDAATGGGSGANTALSNLAAVAINTSLVSDTDITDDLGTQAIRWRNVYAQTVQTGDTVADTLTLSGWDVDGAAAIPFFTITAGNVPTAVLASSVTATTQAASDNSTKLATTAYADTQVSTIAANRALSNLAAVAINTSLISDTDNTDDLGSGSIRWRTIYPITVTTGTSAGNTLTIAARDVDGAVDTAFITLTAGNNPTCALSTNVTGVTQSASDNSTKIATTAYADTQAATRAPANATYIVQTASSGLSAEQALGALATGILKSTTATGVVSIAVNGTDYYGPGTATDVAVADGGTGNSSMTAYAVVCGGTTSTNPLQSIASVGTSGQVLTSNGAGALPTFQANAGGSGSWVYISTGTASASATIDFTGIDATYDAYVIIGAEVVAATDQVDLWARVGTGAGPSWISAANTYTWGTYNVYVTALVGPSAANDTKMIMSGSAVAQFGNNTGENGSFISYLMTPASTNKYHIFKWDLAYFDENGTQAATGGGGTYKATTAVTGLRFMFSSGNITSGTFRLYGIKNS